MSCGHTKECIQIYCIQLVFNNSSTNLHTELIFQSSDPSLSLPFSVYTGLHGVPVRERQSDTAFPSYNSRYLHITYSTNPQNKELSLCLCVSGWSHAIIILLPILAFYTTLPLWLYCSPGLTKPT